MGKKETGRMLGNKAREENERSKEAGGEKETERE